jgi:signal transduction histidine kinase
MPKRERPHKVRLRQLMAAFAIGLTALALVACISLKLLTDVMASRSERLGVAADRAETAEAARADLLTAARAWNLALFARDRPRAAGGIDDEARSRESVEAQARLFRGLERLRASSSLDPADTARVDKAHEAVVAYFAARQHVDAMRTDSRAALGELTEPVDAAAASLMEVSRGEQQTMAAQATRIRVWDVAGDWIGWSVAAAVVLGAVLILVGMFRYVFRPLLELVTSMKQFAEGDRDARAPPSRAAELATAADNFNEMADVITGQHERMIDYLGGIAGELRNPVQIIRTTLEELGPKSPLPAEDKLRARHSVVLRELSRLEQTVDNFLDVSRMQWARLDLQQGKTDVREVLRSVARLYETFSVAHQVNLTNPDEPVCVYADSDRLSQVFSTLVAHAIEFAPRGGIVNVEVATRDGVAVVTVTDQGVGIPHEELGKMFEPFHTRTTTPPKAPSGAPIVALSVARRIVEAHQGRLSADTAAGRGSTFHVCLPLAERHGKATAAA